MKILQICPSHLSDVATNNNQKIIFQHYYSYTVRLFTSSQKKTNRNCYSAALAVYLLLFNASYYQHSPSTASGARYRRSACIDMDMLRLAVAACCDMGCTPVQDGVAYSATETAC